MLEKVNALPARSHGQVLPRGGNLGQTVKVGGKGGAELLERGERVEEERLAALDLAVEAEAVEELEAGRRLVVGQIHVQREVEVAGGDVGDGLLDLDVPVLAVQRLLHGRDQGGHAPHRPVAGGHVAHYGHAAQGHVLDPPGDKCKGQLQNCLIV